MIPVMPLQDMLWFRLLAGLLVGLALGSFTTMLSYRAPRNISIVRPPSHCPKCHTPLKARDLVPLFSWLLARGKCRACGAPIGLRYVLIELVTTGATLIAFVWLGLTPHVIVALVGIVAFVALAAINIERGRN